MLITIEYCQEMNVYKLHDGTREKIIAPCDLAPGAKWAALKPTFDAAKAAHENGHRGITVKV